MGLSSSLKEKRLLNMQTLLINMNRQNRDKLSKSWLKNDLSKKNQFKIEHSPILMVISIEAYSSIRFESCLELLNVRVAP